MSLLISIGQVVFECRIPDFLENILKNIVFVFVESRVKTVKKVIGDYYISA